MGQQVAEGGKLAASREQWVVSGEKGEVPERGWQVVEWTKTRKSQEKEKPHPCKTKPARMGHRYR